MKYGQQNFEFEMWTKLFVKSFADILNLKL